MKGGTLTLAHLLPSLWSRDKFFCIEEKGLFINLDNPFLIELLKDIGMKNYKRIYWISTGLITALMLFSAGMYFFNTAEIKKVFGSLGYPSYIVIPLGIAKVLGLVAIWTNRSRSIKEWAYAGFFFDLVLAFFAHVMVDDGGFGGALAGLVFLFVSYFSWKKIE